MREQGGRLRHFGRIRRNGLRTCGDSRISACPTGHRCHHALTASSLSAAQRPPPPHYARGCHDAWGAWRMEVSRGGHAGPPSRVFTTASQARCAVLLRWLGFSHGREGLRGLLGALSVSRHAPQASCHPCAGSMRGRRPLRCCVILGSRARRHRWLAGGASRGASSFRGSRQLRGGYNSGQRNIRLACKGDRPRCRAETRP